MGRDCHPCFMATLGSRLKYERDSPVSLGQGNRPCREKYSHKLNLDGERELCIVFGILHCRISILQSQAALF